MIVSKPIMKKSILLSGVQPSGVLHIGNYLGAISQWVLMQKTHHVFVMIADLHAITVPQEPAALHENTLRMAKLLIACGIVICPLSVRVAVLMPR